jgi:branched-chain amino acid aminotransferase
MQTYIFDDITFNDTKLESRVPANAVSIYEVVKVINGIALFLEEHLLRLKRSSNFTGNTIHVDDAYIFSQVSKLIEINQICRGRIKFVIAFYPGGRHFYALQAEDIEPAPLLYQTGIKVKSLGIERQNPEAKIIHADYNKAVSKILEDQSIFEVLLVNDDGKLTECSRANIFFIKGNNLYTAHSKDVLSGITRSRVIEIANRNRIKLIETDIRIEELSKFESSFITGTSPGVLPVSHIDDIVFRVENPTLQAISKLYFEEVKTYIDAKQNLKK